MLRTCTKYQLREIIEFTINTNVRRNTTFRIASELTSYNFGHEMSVTFALPVMVVAAVVNLKFISPY